MRDDWPIVEEFPIREPEPMKQPRESTHLDSLTIVFLSCVTIVAVWGAWQVIL